MHHPSGRERADERRPPHREHQVNFPPSTITPSSGSLAAHRCHSHVRALPAQNPNKNDEGEEEEKQKKTLHRRELCTREKWRPRPIHPRERKGKKLEASWFCLW
ncbi:uncharacterized protein HKW66_Vig0083590 [Vigna angularis]|uniref:Uncharacterized protein n=1 Tax=Phaseolus angularis TaxID=3914 RepID=A0A8T0KJ60_PHAAN|nr:uncharacterized protein HKW66_Vig0083590 [Vigna angularis]